MARKERERRAWAVKVIKKYVENKLIQDFF